MCTAGPLSYKPSVAALKELLGHVNRVRRSTRSIARRPRFVLHMSDASPDFREGDRVRAPRRVAFPDGTVIKVLDGYVLVRWDGDVLETAHPRELTKIVPGSGGH